MGSAARERRQRQPVAGAEVPSAANRQPVVAIEFADTECIRFVFSRLDDGGAWSLFKVKPGTVEHVLKALIKFEAMTVEEARQMGSLADYDMSGCPNKNATKRLANQYEGQDALCRLKVPGPGAMRMFGIRSGRNIAVIWFDPRHEVWPEGKTVR